MTPPPENAWGTVVTLAEVPQRDGPALWVRPTGFVAAWIGADAAGVHHDVRLFNGISVTPPLVLPLPPTAPRDQQIIPADDTHMHLFWLDADADGLTRLFTARITAELAVDRGPTPVSTDRAWRYALLPLDDGPVRAVWSGGFLSEPGLFTALIDRSGRPRQPEPLVSDADYPAGLSLNDGTARLFWLNPTDNTIHTADLTDAGLRASRPTGRTLPLEPGDRLDGFRAGADATHGYLFASITRTDGVREILWLSSPLDRTDWSAPRQLRLDTTLVAPLDTGFAGSANLANTGPTVMRQAAPLRGQHDMLAVAAGTDTQVGVIYFRGGQVIGWEAVAPTTPLIGAPRLYADAERELYLTWADPLTPDSANLNVTTTRWRAPD